MTPRQPPLDRKAHADAASTLVRWFAIPLALVAAIYFIQRAYDEKPFVVVTDHGAMPSAGEIAATPPAVPASPAGEPPTTAPLVPTVPAPPPLTPETPTATLRAVAQPSPPYPARALDAEQEGVVRLRLNIAPDGSVSSSQVLNAEPRGWFEHAAQDGVKRWRYEPSELGGTADVDVEFKLK